MFQGIRTSIAKKTPLVCEFSGVGWGSAPIPFSESTHEHFNQTFSYKRYMHYNFVAYMGPFMGTPVFGISNQVRHKPENKCADQTGWLHMLVCIFVVCMQHIQVYSRTEPNYIINKRTKTLCVAHLNLIRFTMLINWYNLTSFSCLKSLLHRHLIMIIIIIVLIFRG